VKNDGKPQPCISSGSYSSDGLQASAAWQHEIAFLFP
jgi:hypothetical protein